MLHGSDNRDVRFKSETDEMDGTMVSRKGVIPKLRKK